MTAAQVIALFMETVLVDKADAPQEAQELLDALRGNDLVVVPLDTVREAMGGLLSYAVLLRQANAPAELQGPVTATLNAISEVIKL